jgi:hypothetical protein
MTLLKMRSPQNHLPAFQCVDYVVALPQERLRAVRQNVYLHHESIFESDVSSSSVMAETAASSFILQHMQLTHG